MRLKLEIYEAEGGLDGAANGASSSVAVRTLEGQNARLKEALVLLRDKHDKTHAELEAVRVTLMQQTTEFVECFSVTKKKTSCQRRCNFVHRHHVLSEQLLLKTAELQKADGAVRALSEQVDATSNAATLMENMTQANMALEDKARALAEEIADLNTVIEMNEQVLLLFFSKWL